MSPAPSSPATPATPAAPSSEAPESDGLDEDLGELPPLDGDLKDAPTPETEADDVDDPDGEASLDDSTGEDEPTDDEELDLDETDSGWLAEPPDDPAIDLGDTGIDFGAEEEAADEGGDEEPGVGQEDFGFGLAPERIGLDAGDEGPVAPDEELRDEDLPALDADDAGDVEDAVLIDPSFTTDEPHGLPWASAPWDGVGAPLPIVRASAVACSERGTLVLGRQEGGPLELWRVDLEGATQALPARGLDVGKVRGLEGQGPAVRALLESEQVAITTDGGLTFARLEATEGVLGTSAPAPREARVPAVHAVRETVEAYAAQRGGVLRRGPSGELTLHAWGGRVTALALLDATGRLVAATYSDADDSTALVHLDAAGVASVVARVGATRADPESDGQVLSMALDEARGVVWVAGGFGLAAFAVR